MIWDQQPTLSKSIFEMGENNGQFCTKRKTTKNTFLQQGILKVWPWNRCKKTSRLENKGFKRSRVKRSSILVLWAWRRSDPESDPWKSCNWRHFSSNLNYWAKLAFRIQEKGPETRISGLSRDNSDFNYEYFVDQAAFKGSIGLKIEPTLFWYELEQTSQNQQPCTHSSNEKYSSSELLSLVTAAASSFLAASESLILDAIRSGIWSLKILRLVAFFRR